ncbi:MAG: phosphoribosylformylglycinamidine synthase, partial [Bacteroidales bacterium]|nr:phosphoribosylformylglycinamidine synthase [Bacteroidales bacterium]
MDIHRIYVEKYSEFQVEAESLLREFNENLSLGLRSLRLINVYDLFGFSDTLLRRCRYSVFGESVTDSVSDSCPLEGKKYLAVEYIPGQFDQRASSAVECVHLIDPDAQVDIRSSRLLIFDDDISEAALAAIRHYFINEVECREKDLSRLEAPGKAEVRPLCSLDGFLDMQPADYPAFCRDWGLAMSTDDLAEVMKYFRAEGRNPSETEIRILDTYWSDHCRHTTFTT